MERSADLKVNCRTKDAIEAETNCLGAGGTSMVSANNSPISQSEDEGYQTEMVFGSFEPRTLSIYGITAVDPEDWKPGKTSNRGFILGKRSSNLLGNRKISKKKSAAARRSPVISDPNIS